MLILSALLATAIRANTLLGLSNSDRNIYINRKNSISDLSEAMASPLSEKGDLGDR